MSRKLNSEKRIPDSAPAGVQSPPEATGLSEARVSPEGEVARMPHERDESAGPSGPSRDTLPEPRISQAGKDVEAGRVDTDRRGIPNDVP